MVYTPVEHSAHKASKTIYKYIYIYVSKFIVFQN